jgi:hypothetical protein
MSPYSELSSALWRLIVAEILWLQMRNQDIPCSSESNILSRDNSGTEEDVMKWRQVCSLCKVLEAGPALETDNRGQ